MDKYENLKCLKIYRYTKFKELMDKIRYIKELIDKYKIEEELESKYNINSYLFIYHPQGIRPLYYGYFVK
jgi:hypothetical protein